MDPNDTALIFPLRIRLWMILWNLELNISSFSYFRDMLAVHQCLISIPRSAVQMKA